MSECELYIQRDIKGGGDIYDCERSLFLGGEKLNATIYSREE